jgi:hypothetical protein
MLGNAGHCMFDFVNLMMRHTAIACHSEAEPREVFQPRMRSLYSMAYLLGIQLAREQVRKEFDSLAHPYDCTWVRALCVS